MLLRRRRRVVIVVVVVGSENVRVVEVDGERRRRRRTLANLRPLPVELRRVSVQLDRLGVGEERAERLHLRRLRKHRLRVAVLERLGRVQVVPLPLVLVHHQVLDRLLVPAVGGGRRSVVQPQPDALAVVVAAALQQLDLVGGERRHRDRLDAVGRRQTAPATTTTTFLYSLRLANKMPKFKRR